MPATQRIQEQPIVAANLWSHDSHWDEREIWVDGCDHESLKARPDFQAWLGYISRYTAERVGSSPRLRMYSYEYGAHTMVALDIFGAQASTDMTITVQVSTGLATLTSPVDGQLDLALPCLVSVMYLVGHLANCRQVGSPRSCHLELWPWAEQPEAQHALTS